MGSVNKLKMAIAAMVFYFAILHGRNQVAGNELCHQDTIEQSKKLLKELTGSDIVFYFTLLDKTVEARVSSADVDEKKMTFQCFSGNDNRQLKSIQIPESGGLKMSVKGKLGVSVQCKSEAPQISEQNLAVSLKITLAEPASGIKSDVAISGWEPLQSGGTEKKCLCGDEATSTVDLWIRDQGWSGKHSWRCSVADSANENRVRLAAAYGNFVAKEFLRLASSCPADISATILKELSKTPKLLVEKTGVYQGCKVAASVDLSGLDVNDFDFACEKGSSKLVEMKSKPNRPMKFAFSGRFCKGCLYYNAETMSPNIWKSSAMPMLGLFTYKRGSGASFKAFRWSVADVTYCNNQSKVLGDLFVQDLMKFSEDIAEKLKALVANFSKAYAHGTLRKKLNSRRLYFESDRGRFGRTVILTNKE